MGDVVDLNEVKSDRKAKLRKCAKCGEKKTLDHFGSNSSTIDGLQTYCKDCRNKLHIKRRERDPSHRIRHHFVTRITKQLGFACPRDLYARLEDYLGYTIPSLVRFLDEDIQRRENISLRKALELGYHIDHKYPLSKFDVQSASDQAFRDCWAISNLWLIPAADNLAKSNKVIEGLDAGA